MLYYFRKLIALLLAVLASLGFVKAVPEEIMNYTDEELALFDEYLRYSHGSEVSLYETKDSAESIYTGTVADLCELPDCPELARAGYIRYAAYTTHYRADGSPYLSYDSYYAVSNRFGGPYSERRLLMIGGGHGNLFFAAFFMFLFSALGPATGNTDLIFYVSMFGEVLMVFFFYLYASKKYRKH